MDQYLIEYLAQLKQRMEEMDARDAQQAVIFDQQKAATDVLLARLDAKIVTYGTTQTATAAATSQDEKPGLCEVQIIETVTVETDNASETKLVQANEASEFNNIILIQADIMNEQASRTGVVAEENMLKHV